MPSKNEKTPLVTYYTKNRERLLEKYRTKHECIKCKKKYSFSYFNKHVCISQT